MLPVVELQITSRARQYGYVFWPKSQDNQMRELLGHADSVEILFENKMIGKKRVDWKYRRISIGPSRTTALGAQLSSFTLACDGDRLEIKCK